MDEVSQFFSVEEKDDLLHNITTAVKDIAGKCRLILGSVNQLLTIFQGTQVFVTKDFAMKLLPKKLKETQKEWFG